MEKNKTIEEIRLLECNNENVDYQSLPGTIGKLYIFKGTKIKAYIERLVYMLRSINFTLPNFSCIFFNLTEKTEIDNINYSKRSYDYYHPWFRFIDCYLDRTYFNNLQENNQILCILELLKKTFYKLFSEDNNFLEVNKIFEDIINLKENLVIPIKNISNEIIEVKCFINISEEFKFRSYVEVYDKIKEDLMIKSDWTYYNHRDDCILQFGQILIQKKRIIIKSRKHRLSNYENDIIIPLI